MRSFRESFVADFKKCMSRLLEHSKVCGIYNEAPDQAYFQTIAKIGGVPEFAMHHLVEGLFARLDVSFDCIEGVRIQLVQDPCYSARQ